MPPCYLVGTFLPGVVATSGEFEQRHRPSSLGSGVVDLRGTGSRGCVAALRHDARRRRRLARQRYKAPGASLGRLAFGGRIRDLVRPDPQQGASLGLTHFRPRLDRDLGDVRGPASRSPGCGRRPWPSCARRTTRRDDVIRVVGFILGLLASSSTASPRPSPYPLLNVAPACPRRSRDLVSALLRSEGQSVVLTMASGDPRLRVAAVLAVSSSERSSGSARGPVGDRPCSPVRWRGSPKLACSSTTAGTPGLFAGSRSRSSTLLRRPARWRSSHASTEHLTAGDDDRNVPEH